MKKTILAVTIFTLLSCSSENDSQEDNNTERNLSPSEKIEGSWSGWGASFYIPSGYSAEDALSINQVGNSNRKNYSFNSNGRGNGHIQPRVNDVALTCEDTNHIYNQFDWNIELVGDRESSYQNIYPDKDLYYLNIIPYEERGLRCRKTANVGNCIENNGEWLPCENNFAEWVVIYFVNDDEFRVINVILEPEVNLNVTYNFYRN